MKKDCCTKLVLSMNFLSSFWFQWCQTYLFLLEVTISTFEGWGKEITFFSLFSFYVKVLWGIPIWNTSFHMYIKVKGDWERERGKNQEERERKRKRERDRERERERVNSISFKFEGIKILCFISFSGKIQFQERIFFVEMMKNDCSDLVLL